MLETKFERQSELKHKELELKKVELELKKFKWRESMMRRKHWRRKEGKDMNWNLQNKGLCWSSSKNLYQSSITGP